MTTAELIVVGVAVGVAAFVQVIAGFGFALLCMPIMTLAIPVEKAVVVSTLLSTVTTSWQSWFLRKDADPPLVKRLTISAYVGMPLGLVILEVVSDGALKVVLGVSVLLATFLLARRLDLRHVGTGLDVAAGFLSGVLNTSLSTNGPPLVFDLHARHLDAARFRATISAVFALCSVGALALFIGRGKVTPEGVHAALIALPAWLVGQSIGWPIRKHMHGERFRVLVLCLLAAAGTTTVVFALT
ncbi:MAG: sulfite exporter TauE/SafE family protein [Actinomycetota bacterium]|nr:sulfite exporter TauE/SafE family protein [Actinomycetota bacterium]